MGTVVTPSELELLLVGLMSNTTRVAALLANANLAADAGAAAFSRGQAGFWAPSDIEYFDQSLRRVDVEREFSVELALPPGTVRHRFELELWPDYELGVLCGPDDVPFYPHFVRKRGVAAPRAGSVAELEPWAWTLEEVIAELGAPSESDQWDLRRWLTYRRDESSSAVVSRLTFDLGLYQEAL